MSSSVFKVYPSSPAPLVPPEDEDDGVLNSTEGETSGTDHGSDAGVLDPASVDEHLKIDSNLVIVVGKDGSVHVDQKTLHSLLANETNDTSVSVVRITSPTPSIEAEIEEERRLLQEQKLQHELESGTGSSDSGSVDSPESSNAAPSVGGSKNDTNQSAAAAGPSGVSTRRSNKPAAAAKKEDVMLDDGETPHVSMMVEGFYPPKEAKKFAEEVLTLAGLRKPLHVETRIDYEFQRYVVANDHCYTPLTSPSQKLPPRPYYEDLDSPIEVRSGDDTLSTDVQSVQQLAEGSSGTRRKRTTSKVIASTSTGKSRRRRSFSRDEINDAEDLQSILEDTDSDYSADSSYPEEDDNDSDFDFSISGRTPKKRKSASQSKPPKSATKKDESAEVGKKKTVKSPKKFEPKTPTSMLNKTGVPRTYGSKRNLQQLVPVPTPQAPPPAPVPAVPAVSAPAPVTVTIIKKDHKKPAKPAHHVEALFSDMTSLFSTPDIIKKVGPGAGRPVLHAMTPTTTPVVTPSTSNAIRVVTPSISNTIRVVTPSTSNTIRGFVQLSPATVRGPQKLPAHISIQTHTSASEEHDKRLDLIDSIVQQELNHPDPKLPLQQPAQPTMTEDIVKMLENNLPPGGVQESGLPITDNSILAALGSNDDGLPEDLLQHVAELAEHKELQEILDKQVLGVIGADSPITPATPLPTPSTSTMIPIPVTQQTPTLTPTHSNTSTANPESLPTMTVKEQLMPRKEAIQIRRSDGRIITLPPIEAPATRSAKRRAQAGTSSSASNVPSVSAASHTTTAPSVPATSSPAAHQAKSSKQSTKVTAGTTSYDDGSGSLMIDESRTKGNRSGTSSRRTSESSTTSGRGKRQSTTAVATAVAAAAEDDVESDASWNSEDDPDRLWCICNQPHNNRFMICCDTCEEWFHGKCVNITKAMGQQMEKDGVDWSCPNCSKKKQEKQQPKMTEFLVSSSSTTSISAVIAATSGGPTAPKVVAVSMSGCVVCGSVSRASSVYCSDECIRKHAGMANSSVATTTPLSSSPGHGGSSSSMTKEKQKDRSIGETGQKSDPLAIPKSGPLIVMERKTGRCLTGKNAPTAENLKEWLLKNPTFEVVAPGSPQAAIILAKQAEVRKLQLVKEAQKKAATLSAAAGQSAAGKVQTQLKVSDQRKLTLSSPPSQPKQHQPQHTSKSPVKTFSRVVAGTPAAKTSQPASATKSATPTPKSSASSTPNSSSGSEHGGKHHRKTATESKPSVKQTAVPAGENIRETVKKTLKEHLVQRSSEITKSDVVRLSEQEIEKFAEEVEEEIFALFNKDTGAKYRAKYRSLVFNIKDRKNLSLFQKICEKRIDAKQLVRMTPEELASQELAQWRQNENKHQLEMIKKSELDLLACAKNYVLKTHKGEEVIEGKRDDRLQLDPSTAVEDVVAVLNNSTVSSTSEMDSTLSPSKDNYRKDYDFHGKYSTGLYGSGSITSSTASGSGATATGSATGTSSTSASTSSVKKKESTRRSRSRSRSRDRNKDRSRSHSKHKRRRSRSHERRSRSRERERERDRDRHHHRDHHKSDHKSEHKSVHHKSEHKSDHHHKKHDSRDSREKSVSDKSKAEASSSVPSEKDKNEAVGKSTEASKHLKKAETKPQTLESFNLIDQILSSGSSGGGKMSEVSNKTSKAESEEPIPATTVEQDQEPTSTVTIPTPPHSTSFDNESPTNEFASSDSEDNRRNALLVHWTGNVHMVDVASVEMSIRSVSGEVEDVSREFPEDLYVCGTIKPEIVWNYIGQIKKNVTKEICLVRFHSNESAAYNELYSRLLSRERYGVVKSFTAAIKDFYICPLPANKMIPMILKPLRGVGIIEGDKKPNLLLGIIVKIKGSSRSATLSTPVSAKTPRRQTKGTSSSSSTAVSPSFALMQQVITKYATVNKKALTSEPETAISTPSGSPGSPVPSTSSSSVPSATAVSAAKSEPKISRTRSESSDHGEVDMDIIKAPIATKAVAPKEPIAAVVIDDDDDEPYSPGGVSDDSDHFADVTAIVETKTPALDSESERIIREMEKINRKIAEEKNEIVGIINKADLKEEEIKSTLDPSLITDISIPSNLSEILASIKSTPSSAADIMKGGSAKEAINNAPVTADDEDEYVPTAVYSGYKPGYGYGASKAHAGKDGTGSTGTSGTSRLANLSEEELLRMVPDDSYLQPAATKKPTVPVVELDSDDSAPMSKKPKWDTDEPPPPGMEGDMDF